ncbi:MAG: universal stress protein [Nitrospirae bacterium]|nr:universal stress protein [Nitrospirota bacterium]
MYKTLLVGYDDSKYSKAALIEAANWVRRHGGKLFLAHAVFFDTEEFSIAPEQQEKRLKIGGKLCQETKEKIVSEFGIEATSLLCEGEPPAVILDVAEGKNADLIVMGTYGRRGLNRLLMGSVTSRVIVNSKVDVLVVKKPCTECTGIYKSILVPFDGSEFSKKALGRACQLSKVDGADITVLYVIPRYEEMIGFFRTESIKQSLFKEAEKIMDEAKKIALSHGVSIAVTIQDGHAGDEIIETANGLKNDLIVMGTYGWKGVNKAIMGSTTERVIMNAKCPVLVVR